MTDVLFAVALIVVGTLALFYPLATVVVVAREAHRAHGGVAAVAAAVLASALWYATPLYAFLVSLPVLVALRLVERVRARPRIELPRAIVLPPCPAPR